MIDLNAYKIRYEAICEKFEKIDRLATLAIKAGKASPDANAEWYKREFDSPEEAEYEDERNILDEEILAFMRDLTDVMAALSAAFEEWQGMIEKHDLTIEHLAPSIIDFIDQKITNGQASSVKDIVALFEEGELRGIITANDEVDADVLDALEKKIAKKAKTTQTFEDEEDIF